jgi:hypothetical protein
MKNSFKKITIPTDATKDVLARESWKVMWISRCGQFSGDTNKECEFFLSEKEANDFAEALRAAFKLIRHTSNTCVSVQKNV